MKVLFLRLFLIFYILASSTFIIVVDSSSAPGPANECEKEGYFGKDCRFQCHCKGKAPCDNNGHCPDGCTGGYMGTQCQDVILARWSASGTKKAETGDTVYTCPESTNRKVSISNKYPQGFQWVRVWTRKDVSKENIQITVKINNQATDCPKPVVAHKGTGVMDVFCPNNSLMMTKMDLSGGNIKHWCRAYVSGGRNLAMGQVTEVTPSKKPTSTGYLKVIDGVIAKTFKAHVHTCISSGANAEERAKVNIIFREPINVYKIATVGRPGFIQRSMGLTVTAVDPAGRKIYSSRSSTASLKFTVIPKSVIMNVKKIELSRPPKKSGQKHEDGYVTLCEVFVYGDCMYKTYGLTCSIKPKVIPGSPYCPPTIGCMGNCIRGVGGKFCSEQCPSGSYGLACRETCSETCANSTCDGSWGSCLKCVPGKHGPNCTESCSKFCKKDECYMNNASCTFGCSSSEAVGPKCVSGQSTGSGHLQSIGHGPSDLLPLILASAAATSILCLLLAKRRKKEEEPVEAPPTPSPPVPGEVAAEELPKAASPPVAEEQPVPEDADKEGEEDAPDQPGSPRVQD